MPANTHKYASQPAKRAPVTPPHVTLSVLRAATGLTLDAVCARIKEECPELAPTRGALSAIERGIRGASDRMLRALEMAYGIPDGSLTTSYTPRNRSQELDVA